MVRPAEARFAVPEAIDEIRGLIDENVLNYIKFTASRGVEMRTHARPPSGMTLVRSHKSLEEHPVEILTKVWEDLRRHNEEKLGATKLNDMIQMPFDGRYVLLFADKHEWVFKPLDGTPTEGLHGAWVGASVAGDLQSVSW